VGHHLEQSPARNAVGNVHGVGFDTAHVKQVITLTIYAPGELGVILADFAHFADGVDGNSNGDDRGSICVRQLGRVLGSGMNEPVHGQACHSNHAHEPLIELELTGADSSHDVVVLLVRGQLEDLPTLRVACREELSPDVGVADLDMPQVYMNRITGASPLTFGDDEAFARFVALTSADVQDARSPVGRVA
jgi:hypothetical protein